MTEQDANACVAYLADLFPRMPRTADRVNAIHRAFLPLDRKAVREAIAERIVLDEFPDLVAICAAARAKCPPPRANAGPTSRLNGVSPEQIEKEQLVQLARQAEWDRLDRTIFDMPAAERSERIEKAFATMPGELAQRLRRNDPLKSPLVKALIGEQLGLLVHDAVAEGPRPHALPGH